jgi:glucokinase
MPVVSAPFSSSINVTTITFDNNGNMFIADGLVSRILKFNNNGDYITNWGSYGRADNSLTLNPVGCIDISQ